VAPAPSVGSAAGIAHEVRNVLAGISGAIQVLKRNAAWKELPPGFGDEVDFQVARIARIVAEFLAYARPGELRLQPADLQKIAEHALARTNGTDAPHRVERDYQAGDAGGGRSAADGRSGARCECHPGVGGDGAHRGTRSRPDDRAPSPAMVRMKWMRWPCSNRSSPRRCGHRAEPDRPDDRRGHRGR
jgi:hypothetical protein